VPFLGNDSSHHHPVHTVAPCSLYCSLYCTLYYSWYRTSMAYIQSSRKRNVSNAVGGDTHTSAYLHIPLKATGVYDLQTYWHQNPINPIPQTLTCYQGTPHPECPMGCSSTTSLTALPLVPWSCIPVDQPYWNQTSHVFWKPWPNPYYLLTLTICTYSNALHTRLITLHLLWHPPCIPLMKPWQHAPDDTIFI
jgi:hypothetical protein